MECAKKVKNKVRFEEERSFSYEDTTNEQTEGAYLAALKVRNSAKGASIKSYRELKSAEMARKTAKFKTYDGLDKF